MLKHISSCARRAAIIWQGHEESQSRKQKCRKSTVLEALLILMATFSRKYYLSAPPDVSFGQSLIHSLWMCSQLWLIKAGSTNPVTDFSFLQSTVNMEIKTQLSPAQSPWDLS